MRREERREIGRKSERLTCFLKPKKAPKKVRGREMPNHRQSRARRVVKGMAALDPAPHRNRFRVKNTEKHVLGQGNSKREKERERVCVRACVRVCVCVRGG